MKYKNSSGNNRKANFVIGLVILVIVMLTVLIDYLFKLGWFPK